TLAGCLPASPVALLNWVLRVDSPSCVVFFFFQAEDGIRDDLVTGVQTCALPISACARTRILEAWSRRMLAKANCRTLRWAVNTGSMPLAFPRNEFRSLIKSPGVRTVLLRQNM